MRKTPSLIKQIMEKSKKDSWHVKLKRKIRLKIFIFTCATRWLWDKDYQHYIFKKKL
jgi:hypothetical protein